MNAVPKLVASHTLSDTTAWPNSAILEGDLLDAVELLGGEKARSSVSERGRAYAEEYYGNPVRFVERTARAIGVGVP